MSENYIGHLSFDGLDYQSSSADQVVPKNKAISNKNEIFREKDTLVVPDIHGDLDALQNCLDRFGFINEQRDWVAGQARLVLLGDLIDRGGQDIEVLDYVIDLKSQIQDSGGDFSCLVGNHELLWFNAIYGDPYTDPSIKTTIRTFLVNCRGLLKDFGIEEIPRDFLKIREVFFREENQKYLKFLSSLDVFYQFDDFLAVHGSVGPTWSKFFHEYGVDIVNQDFRESFYSGFFGKYNNVPKVARGGSCSFDESSPMWADHSGLAGLSLDQELELFENLDQMFVNTVLCGHQYGDVARRYKISNLFSDSSKEILCLDTSMTRGYGKVTKAGGMMVYKGYDTNFEIVNADGSIHTNFDEIQSI